MKDIWGLGETIEQISMDASGECLLKLKRVENSALTHVE